MKKRLIPIYILLALLNISRSESLPETTNYQKEIYNYLASLSTNDYLIITEHFQYHNITNLNELYKLYVLAQHIPDISAIKIPPARFLLQEIQKEDGIYLPTSQIFSQSLAWLASWKYPGNSYFKNKALKRRAYLLAIIDALMLEKSYNAGNRAIERSDFLGGSLIWIGYTISKTKDILPENVFNATRELLLGHIKRIRKWGVKGAMLDMDLFAPIGLWYSLEAIDERPETSDYFKDHFSEIFLNPDHFHPAGYFTDNNCFDASYNGISMYFASWLALLTKNPVAIQSIQKTIKLRKYLSFPDPAGYALGPSHMSSRTSADSPNDQWRFEPRLFAQLFMDDEMLPPSSSVPSTEKLILTHSNLINNLNRLISSTNIPSRCKWNEAHWSRELNFASDYMPDNQYEMLCLRLQNRKLTSSVYFTSNSFFIDFTNAFLVFKQGDIAGAIHYGKVGIPFGHNNLPYGFGDGTLSLLWKKDGGTFIVGRRRGVQGKVTDSYESWRSFPVNAIFGLNSYSNLMTSAISTIPAIHKEENNDAFVLMATTNLLECDYKNKKTRRVDTIYQKSFKISRSGELTLETYITNLPKSEIIELYENIPLFLKLAPNEKPAEIKIVSENVNESEILPSNESKKIDEVSKIISTRHNSRIEITFNRPVSIIIQPIWVDGYQTAVQCLPISIDLLKCPINTNACGVVYKIK